MARIFVFRNLREKDFLTILGVWQLSGGLPGGSEPPNGTPERTGVALGLFGTLGL